MRETIEHETKEKKSHQPSGAGRSGPTVPDSNPGRPGQRPLHLPPHVRDRLRAWSLAGHPHEVCGLLIGLAGEGAIRVERATGARNLATDRLADRFTLDPVDFVRADAAARRDGLEIVGIWHSHPDHPARPSPSDLDSAWEGYSYLIVSVQRDAVEAIRSFRLDGASFVEEPIEECDP